MSPSSATTSSSCSSSSTLEAHKVVNNIKHKAANDPARYDNVVEEAVAILFGLREESGGIAATAEALALQARLRRTDWLRYQRFRATEGTMPLQQWVDRQNRESTALFVFEILDSVAMGLLLAILVIEAPKDGNYAPPAIALGVTGAILGGLLTLDWLNIGGVKLKPE